MKLRNKKTGEIIDLEIANIKATFGEISVIPELAILGGNEYVYHSLASLNEEWEDYKEPLIKDEKIRKAVRAWAEVNELKPDSKVRYSGVDYSLYSNEESIEFNICIKGLVHLDDYTIEELCGSEE